jgi:ankyrin repeat protein
LYEKDPGKLKHPILNSLFTGLVNVTDSQLQTPLHIAATYCNIPIMEFLVSKGADVNALGWDPSIYPSPVFNQVPHTSPLNVSTFFDISEIFGVKNRK